MSNLPDWVMHPTNPNAAAKMAGDISAEIATRKLVEILADHPDADPEEVAHTPRFRSEVAFEVLKLTAENQALADRSLNEQAVVVEREQLHLHHPNEYETVTQFLTDALADTNRSLSEVSDMRFYVGTVVPYMKEQGLPDAAKVWVKGKNVKKARAAKPALNKAFKQLEKARKSGDKTATRQVEQMIDKIIGDVTDEIVTAEEFIARRHGSELPPDMDPLIGYKYLNGDGVVMVLVAMSDAQRVFVEESMGNFADWHLGTSHDAVLVTLPTYSPTAH